MPRRHVSKVFEIGTLVRVPQRRLDDPERLVAFGRRAIVSTVVLALMSTTQLRKAQTLRRQTPSARIPVRTNERRKAKEKGRKRAKTDRPAHVALRVDRDGTCTVRSRTPRCISLIRLLCQTRLLLRLTIACSRVWMLNLPCLQSHHLTIMHVMCQTSSVQWMIDWSRINRSPMKTLYVQLVQFENVPLHVHRTDSG